MMPTELYKYRPWNENTKKMLMKSELYFNSAEGLNDPFEVSLRFDMTCTREEYMLRFLNACRTQGIVPSAEQLKKAEERDMEEQGKIFQDDILKEFRTKSGICSLSAVRDNILMWSHYTKDHTGICLEFNHTLDRVFAARKVNYFKTRPKLNYYKSTQDEKINFWFFSKAIDWEYEEEYRFIISGAAKTNVKFEPALLTGVIIGCKMATEHIDELVDILEKRPTPVQLYKAEISEDEFKLNINPYKK